MWCTTTHASRRKKGIGGHNGSTESPACFDARAILCLPLVENAKPPEGGFAFCGAPRRPKKGSLGIRTKYSTFDLLVSVFPRLRSSIAMVDYGLLFCGNR